MHQGGAAIMWKEIHSSGEQKRNPICQAYVPGDLLRTHEPVAVASFRTWRGWRDCVA